MRPWVQPQRRLPQAAPHTGQVPLFPSNQMIKRLEGCVFVIFLPHFCFEMFFHKGVLFLKLWSRSLIVYFNTLINIFGNVPNKSTLGFLRIF